MDTMRDAINASETLTMAGAITEYLPAYAVLVFTFREGLTVQIAGHPNGMYQATLDGFYALEPAPADAIVAYLERV